MIKRNLRIIAIAIILLGGAGLVFSKVNTMIWYLSAVVALLGYLVMAKAEKKK